MCDLSPAHLDSLDIERLHLSHLGLSLLPKRIISCLCDIFRIFHPGVSPFRAYESFHLLGFSIWYLGNGRSSTQDPSQKGFFRVLRRIFIVGIPELMPLGASSA